MTTPVDPFAAMEARRAEQTAEYGTYAAVVQIWTGPTLAYDVGHPVPASNVNPLDLSVVINRHYCPPILPGQPDCQVPNNQVMAYSAPGAVVDLSAKSSAAPAKAAPKKEF
jgi:hypothetical protein